jgi:protein-tyrosine phosphatase
LPGVDDGPASLDDSLALLRAAHAAGTKTLVATPHVSPSYPTEPDTIEARVEELRPLSPVELLAGAEVAHEPVLELPDETLRRLTLGSSNTILLESPLSPSVGPAFERAFETLLERGYRVLLAHPERAAIFLGNPQRLRALVERGALCSITASALSGRFGQGPKWFAFELLRDGLVHSVDSDAHNTSGRPPGLREGMLDAAETLPFVAKHAGWYMTRVPAAILADEPLPQQ